MGWNKPTKKKRPDAHANQLVGPPKLVRKKRGETWKDRHQRRLDAAVEHRELLETFGAVHGIEVKLLDEGRYWRFILHRGDGGKWGNEARWWPEEGDLKLGKGIKCKHIHTHDVVQVREILAKAWRL